MFRSDAPLPLVCPERPTDSSYALDVVGEAENGQEAIDAVAATSPDVVVMDIRMPLTDGIAATSEILATLAVPPRVLILTTFDHDQDVYEALRAGASGSCSRVRRRPLPVRAPDGQ